MSLFQPHLLLPASSVHDPLTRTTVTTIIMTRAQTSKVLLSLAIINHSFSGVGLRAEQLTVTTDMFLLLHQSPVN